jgi:tetratricopeptide (TPR) repeat protein
MSEQDALLTVNDRQQAEHFTAQGELRLLHNDSTGIGLFESAMRYDPINSQLLYRQGLALFEYGSMPGNERALALAAKKFRNCVEISPLFSNAWGAWGHVLAHQGQLAGEWQILIEANKKFFRALSLVPRENIEALTELTWHRALILFAIAQHSEEAMDYQNAIDAFQESSSYPEYLDETFWISFGKVCAELGGRIGDVRLLVKALHCFKHSVTVAVGCCEGWESMADTLYQLYEKTHDEDHFSQANECYSASAQLEPEKVKIWLKWAAFLHESGKRAHDLKRIRAATEKCQRAAAIDRQHPHLLAIWAETLSSMGELTERLELLHEAHNKVAEASELAPQDLRVCLAHGTCLQAFGHYFQDADYYYQAIEKWQTGLSYDRTAHKLWHAIACTYLMVGTVQNDTEALERACRFFNKARNLHTSSVYFFDYGLALSKLGEIRRNPEYLEQAVASFEQALNLQKNAAYLHPEWLFYYASTLDLLGDYQDNPSVYSRAIEIFSHVLTIDPDFPMIHHRLGLVFCHMGEILNEVEYYQKALHSMRLAARREEDNDQILVDWAITLINIAESSSDPQETETSLREAEIKLTQACKLGNPQAYYHIACLHSLLKNYERSVRFLEKAEEFDALPPLEELLEDEWLAALRETSYFRDFLSRLEKAGIPDGSDEDAEDDTIYQK